MPLGAATSLALALLVGGRIFAAMKQSLGRRRMGAPRAWALLVLAGVAAIAFGFDTGFLTRLSLANTTRFEQGLIDMLRPTQRAKTRGGGGQHAFPSKADAGARTAPPAGSIRRR